MLLAFAYFVGTDGSVREMHRSADRDAEYVAAEGGDDTAVRDDGDLFFRMV